MYILLILIIGISIYFLIKQFKQIRQLKTNTERNYKKYLEEKYKNLESEADKKFQEKTKFYISQIEKEEERLELIRKNGELQVKKGIDTAERLANELLNDRLKAKQGEGVLCFEKYKKSLEEKKVLYEKEISLVKLELEDFHRQREAINEAIKRERELSEKEDFYKIQLSLDDIEDIQLLKSMTSRLRHREIIPKLIWDSLISRPTNEMIKRVVGDKVGGIYKITYVPTGESYIGKTVSFKDRWKNHIQTALGMEKAASSTLHTHMARNGVWNYSFEILEEVSKEKQSEREKFYINLYGTQKQLNMKVGG